MGENMVSDASLQVLAERLSAALDDLKEMKGQISALHIVNTKIAGLEKDVISVDRKVEVALQKSDAMDNLFITLKEDVIAPLKQEIATGKVEVAANRRWVRTMAGAVPTVFALMVAAGFVWKPWQPDIEAGSKKIQDQFDAARAKRDEQQAKYSQDVGKELQSDDRRITVLEFRANNVDHKGSK